jgi:SEL1 protein
MSTANLFFLSFLAFSLTLTVTARPFVLVLSQDDFKDDAPSDPDDAAEWDEFGDSDTHKSEDDLDPGSWRPIFEPSAEPQSPPQSESDALYYPGVEKLLSGDLRLMEEGAGEIETAGESGHPAAQSVLGFLWGMGLLRERSKSKAFLYHHFAAEGGNMQSKMALAYTYTRQDVSDLAQFPFTVSNFSLHQLDLEMYNYLKLMLVTDV